MQAIPFHTSIIPSNSPSVSRPAVRVPPAHAISFPDSISQAISISVPGQNVSVPRETVDEKVTAFWDYQFLFVSQRSETEAPIMLCVVDGAIPADFPLGTYYLTGPGLFTDDHGSTVHPLDGHGYLRAFTIDGVKGEVKFMARYIKTEAQVEECDHETGEWKFTHRGPFSVLKGGKKVGNTKVMKNVANTSVLRWGGRLFCLWEGGDPYEIESTSLDTVGKFKLIDGCDDQSSSPKQGVKGRNIWDIAAKVLKPILYGVFNMPPKRLLSHYKIDACRNRLLIMSCNAEDMLLPQSNFTFYETDTIHRKINRDILHVIVPCAKEFDSNFKMLQRQEFNIPDHLMIHDWAFTDTHYVLFGNRIKLDIPGSMTAVCGLSPMISALSVNPSKPTSPIYLLPRFKKQDQEAINGGLERDWRVPIEAPAQMWVLHVGNAFEARDENGNLQIQIQASGCSYQWFNFQTMFGYDWQSGKLDPSMMNAKQGLPHLVNVNINLDTSGKCQECTVNPLNEKWKKPTDFPVIHHEYAGSKNKYIYAATSSGTRRELPHFPFDTVVKLNNGDNSVQTWSVGTRRFIGEPIFVPKGDEEDDGYLLVVEYAVATQRCYLVILDSKRIGEANAFVARVEVPRHLNFPLGFHGFWSPSKCTTGVNI